MTSMILDYDKMLNKKEFDFFLRGNTSLDPPKKKKPFDWISDQGWKDSEKLCKISTDMTKLQEDIENNGVLWKKW